MCRNMVRLSWSQELGSGSGTRAQGDTRGAGTNHGGLVGQPGQSSRQRRGVYRDTPPVGAQAKRPEAGRWEVSRLVTLECRARVETGSRYPVLPHLCSLDAVYARACPAYARACPCSLGGDRWLSAGMVPPPTSLCPDVPSAGLDHRCHAHHVLSRAWRVMY